MLEFDRIEFRPNEAQALFCEPECTELPHMASSKTDVLCMTVCMEGEGVIVLMVGWLSTVAVDNMESTVVFRISGVSGNGGWDEGEAAAAAAALAFTEAKAEAAFSWDAFCRSRIKCD